MCLSTFPDFWFPVPMRERLPPVIYLSRRYLRQSKLWRSTGEIRKDFTEEFRSKRPVGGTPHAITCRQARWRIYIYIYIYTYTIIPASADRSEGWFGCSWYCLGVFLLFHFFCYNCNGETDVSYSGDETDASEQRGEFPPIFLSHHIYVFFWSCKYM